MSEEKEVAIVEEDGSMSTNEEDLGTYDVSSSEDSEYILEFKKPYKFDGKKYTRIDLSGLEDLTTRDLKEAEKIYNTTGNFSAISEMTVSFACIVAHMATKRPLEFFEGLPANEGIRLKNELISYFYS